MNQQIPRLVKNWAIEIPNTLYKNQIRWFWNIRDESDLKPGFGPFHVADRGYTFLLDCVCFNPVWMLDYQSSSLVSQQTRWLVMACHHVSFLFKCPSKLWQWDREPAWKTPGPWDWSSKTEFNRHSFLQLTCMFFHPASCENIFHKKGWPCTGIMPSFWIDYLAWRTLLASLKFTWSQNWC